MSLRENSPVQQAWEKHSVVPAFNIPYIPMMKPVVRALKDCQTVGLIAVARLEWIKFKAGSLAMIRETYEKVKDERFTRLHLDHIPVIDEDGCRVDYRAIIQEAIQLGYQSVMIDGSRLPLNENIAVTREVAELAHAADVPVEAELGAVLGHEAGPLPPYEELFATGKGFTDPKEAGRFVHETGTDWLSVAVGNIHGAVSKARRDETKIEARLNIEHLRRIQNKARVPLVLHGGSGIRQSGLLESVRNGIAKINIGTTIRQAYEKNVTKSVEAGQEAVYHTVTRLVRDELKISGSANC
ncbi:class II fructose-bisphosphate aldolase [candidate division KSB1 bacterium]|nr:class II fructose-bisphosphate aldolase [candidate division KSB1 bacterium]